MLRKYFRELATDATLSAVVATAGAGIAVVGFGAPVVAAGFVSATVCATTPYVGANIMRALAYGRDALEKPINFTSNLMSYAAGTVVAAASALAYAGTGLDEKLAEKVSDPTSRAAVVATGALFLAHNVAFGLRASGLFGRRAAPVVSSGDYHPLEGVVAATPAVVSTAARPK